MSEREEWAGGGEGGSAHRGGSEIISTRRTLLQLEQKVPASVCVCVCVVCVSVCACVHV